jgi:hypothetical protein
MSAISVLNLVYCFSKLPEPSQAETWVHIKNSQRSTVFKVCACVCVCVCRKGKGHSGHHVISSSDVPAVKTSAAQLTEDNEDFADRVRYHQSEVIKGQNFDSYYQGD